MRFFVKSFLVTFLVIFFINSVLPGIDVLRPTKLPHVGGDVYFALVLSLLHSLVYPILRVIQHPTYMRNICIGVLSITFVAYALMKIAPIGVEITSIEGYLLASGVVSLVGIIVNYLEMKHSPQRTFRPPPEEGGIVS